MKLQPAHSAVIETTARRRRRFFILISYCRVIGTRAKARDYVLSITAVANLVVAGFSLRSIHSHGHRPPLQYERLNPESKQILQCKLQDPRFQRKADPAELRRTEVCVDSLS